MFTGVDVREHDTEFVVETTVERGSAKDLNRLILSTLRKVEKRTRLRAEWTPEDTISTGSWSTS